MTYKDKGSYEFSPPCNMTYQILSHIQVELIECVSNVMFGMLQGGEDS